MKDFIMAEQNGPVLPADPKIREEKDRGDAFYARIPPQNEFVEPPGQNPIAVEQALCVAKEYGHPAKGDQVKITQIPGRVVADIIAQDGTRIKVSQEESGGSSTARCDCGPDHRRPVESYRDSQFNIDVDGGNSNAKGGTSVELQTSKSVGDFPARSGESTWLSGSATFYNPLKGNAFVTSELTNPGDPTLANAPVTLRHGDIDARVGPGFERTEDPQPIAQGFGDMAKAARTGVMCNILKYPGG
jgi:hypothetical protein